MMRPLKINRDNPVHVNSRWTFIILGILIMMFLGTVYSYSVFRVELQKELQIGLAESGMPYMFALAFYSLFMFLNGKHIERYAPRNIIIAGGSLVALGWIVSSFAGNIVMLTISYGAIGGAGVGITYGVLMNVIAKWFPDKKGLASGLVLVGFGLSPLVTAPLARILVESVGVMRAFLYLGVSFGVLMPVLAFSFRYPSQDEVCVYSNKTSSAHKSINMRMRDMVRTMSFKGIYINFTIGTMIGLMMIGMTTNVGIEYFELESTLITGLMALFAVFNGIGRPTFGWISDHYGPRHAMFLSYMLILVAAALVIIFENHVSVYIVAFSIFWFNLGGWLAIAPTSTLKLYGIENYSQNYGLVFTAYGIGAIAGVSSSGVLLDYLGSYLYIFYYVIALCLIGVLLTSVFIRKDALHRA